ncbi:metalloregulator ArsR/SmtB family transcription factor [Aquibacillus halophilus]|uniref:Metalloregulator ArsR/SmtB family transcription factor n=1 Tax=Aquibacillus halophilus TaxID=930132 RepID=A0A6A8DRA0_9BACI|nr:metalloregulator ArsR/SmtB family transcription factor [Aquibacillus halophilus]MRH43732.1 metalloregulator ArsR/SmtB family transcription factor [Aquibacillus halophilus]
MSATQIVLNQEQLFKTYEKKFKALSDEIRLKVLYELNQRGQVCVCDLTDIIGLPQSKLSYHLKILLDVELVKREKIGTWNYYCLNEEEVKSLLSEELCCLFYPSNKVGQS